MLSGLGRSGVVPALGLLIVVGGLASCGRDGNVRASSSASQTWEISSPPLVSIGQASGDPDYLFSHVAAVRLLPAGQVLVADNSTASLKVFGRSGRLERQMGDRGEGPGEFREFGAVSFVAPDTIVVFDPGLVRITRLLLTGRVLKTVEFRTPDGLLPQMYVGSFSDGSYALAWVSAEPRDWSKTSADAMVIGRFGRDGKFEGVIGKGWGMRRQHAPLPFSPSFNAVLIGDEVYTTDGVDGRVDVTTVSAGTGVATIAFRVSAKSWTLGDAVRRLSSALDSTGAQRLSAMKGVAGLDTIPTLSDMIVGEAGRLWIKTYDPATDSYLVSRNRAGGEWAVVKPDGTPVASVTIPADVRLMDVRGDRLAGVGHDDLGIERVKVFELRRGVE